jgi:Na+/H+ antiporter
MSAASQYEFLVLLLVAIVVLELLARRLHLPPAAAFIIGGITLALSPGVPTFSIDPDLVLVIFMPPLLMNGAYFTVWREFRENVTGIMLLALGAVAFTTFAVGIVTKQLVPGLPWALCFALGAIVSPPDAVAAGAILERLSLPSRLGALLQGESLLNDASGLVIFRFAVAAALTGAFSVPAAIGQFFVLTIGGIAFGFLVAWIGIFVIRRLRDSELIITSSLLLAALSYVGGESLHVSGVLATVTTGLVFGRRQHEVFSAATRIRAQAFWKVLVFLLESILFILIGLSLRGVLARMGAAQSLLAPIFGVIVAVFGSRVIWMFGSDVLRRGARLLGYGGGSDPSLSMATVMSWAGMRGVVTLAAALSLPVSLTGRHFILVASFSVILVTVLLQGTTLAPLIRLLGLTGGPAERRLRQESEDLAWMRMTEAQFRTIQLASLQPDGTQRHPRLLEQFGHRARLAAQFIAERDAHSPIKREHFNVVLQAIDAGRAEVLQMHRIGEIHDRVLREMERDLDLQQLVAESHTD